MKIEKYIEMWENKSAQRQKNSAGSGTWTRTILLPQAPEACASANSAIPAHLLSMKIVCRSVNDKWYYTA